jgi:hypothetical protein
VTSGTAHAPDVARPPSVRRPGGARERVLVVYREGRRGEAALREGAELAAAGAELEVVTLAPVVKPYKCCGGGAAGPYNSAMRVVADQELTQARTLLGTLAGRASFTRLTGCTSPPLAEWSAARSFDVVILPRERLARGGGSLARSLRAATNADIRLTS